jgi:lysophospholipase L1-like esterase
MADYALQIFSPHDVYDAPDQTIPRWDDYKFRFLAQGDSWFSIGAIPPWATSNILRQVRLSFEASAINCAYPGRELAHMVDWVQDTGFSRLISGRFAYRWNGILLSGGGNDLIDAAGVLPVGDGGMPVAPSLRLLLTPEEWGPAENGAARYLSDEGWATFVSHLAPQFDKVVAQRDSGVNKDVPIFCHTYAYPMPRNAAVSELFNMGPWLYPAVSAYKIPQGDWFAVATELINRLAELLGKIIGNLNQPQSRGLYLIQTQQALIPAEPGTKGPSGDWENEIHPTPGGYRKLADQWRSVIEAHATALA